MANPFPWPVDRIREMYQAGKSLQEIADILGSGEWQAYWRKHLGREYRPNQKVVNKVAKREGIALRGRGAPMSRNRFWKGGRVIDKGGYILVKSPNHPMATQKGYVREHRLVMEKILGRFLTETEVVHHKDDDTGNNDPENLLLFDTNSIHISTTTKGKAPPERTLQCRSVIAKQRLDWWPSDLIRQWYVVDLLSRKAIGILLDKSDSSVSKALARIGVVLGGRFDRSRRQKPTAEHKRQAREFLATAGPQP